MKIPEFVQHYKIHMTNGDVIDWHEDYDAEPGIVDCWCDYLEGKNTAKVFLCETFFGPYAYIPYENISYILVGAVKHTGPGEPGSIKEG